MANRPSGEPNFIISNKIRKKSVKVSMEIADNELLRMRGLMFRSKIIPILFVFPKAGLFPIHSHFVRQPFDAVYLSEEGRVLEIFRKIPPNTSLVSPKKKAKFLLELPVEVFDRLEIQEGDLVSWREL
ncbi:MAG: DUF192 domain-containing protein [Candidatus Micrarchaeota archaeon]|nr:DUF192 domain-containing protein [Candidatus Micrarchaeota archaeon]